MEKITMPFAFILILLLFTSYKEENKSGLQAIGTELTKHGDNAGFVGFKAKQVPAVFFIGSNAGN